MPTRKEFEEYARGLNPIDDLMFSKMAESKEFCEEILRVILEDDKLIVTENIPQCKVENLHGRSIIMDAKCVTGDGRHINIEVQKADNDDHLRRVRYNGSVLTTNITETGTKFEFVPDVCVIFISAFDMFKSGLPLYHVKKVVMETGQIVEDGLTEIYANAVIDNGSKFSKLMKVFTENDTYNTDDFPVTSEIKARFKFDEGGAVKMDETLQRWMRESEAIGEKRGEERGEKRGEKRGEERGEKRGEKRGRREGRREGEKLGAKNEKIKIAGDLKKRGFKDELIAEITGLSEKIIMAL